MFRACGTSSVVIPDPDARRSTDQIPLGSTWRSSSRFVHSVPVPSDSICLDRSAFSCADRMFPGCLQSDDMASESLPQLPDSTCGSGLTSVPVFNCVAILSPIPGGTKLAGRIANLAGISGEGNTERDVLILLTKRFKATVQEFSQKQQPIPWIDPPEIPGPGEMQRFIPVHL